MTSTEAVAPCLWQLKPSIFMLLKIVLDLASLDGFNFFQWLNDLFFHVDSPQIASFGLKFVSFHTSKSPIPFSYQRSHNLTIILTIILRLRSSVSQYRL